MSFGTMDPQRNEAIGRGFGGGGREGWVARGRGQEIQANLVDHVLAHGVTMREAG